MSKRSSSSKLFFYDLHGLGTKVQVMADARYIRFFSICSSLQTRLCSVCCISSWSWATNPSFWIPLLKAVKHIPFFVVQSNNFLCNSDYFHL